MEPIRILIVDDQTMFREGLRTLLSVQPDLKVVGEAENGEEALRQCQKLNPQVVLMDLRMPQLDGVAATRALRNQMPAIHILVLTTFEDDDSIFEALRAGASGYLLKDAPSEKLYEAIRAAARGESFLQPSVAARVVAEFARLAGQGSARPDLLPDPLSDRELEVLRLLATGDSNREIAAKLFITEGTTKNHITSILGKLGVTDRTQAALKARELGLL